MLAEICAECRNYFLGASPSKRIFRGTYTVSDGQMPPLDFLKHGQYFRIIGSTFNDGVYQYPVAGLTDEEFEGTIWAMSPPPDFIKLCEKIKAFNESDGGKPTAYTSESFEGYSYSKATDSSGTPLRWQKVFAKELNQYRRLFVI